MIDFVYCQICDALYMVGFMGKSIKGKGSGGNLGGVPYLALGNEELENVPNIFKEGDGHPCPHCGLLCKVSVGKPVESERRPAGDER